MAEKCVIFKPRPGSPSAFVHDHDAADFRHIYAVISRRFASLTRSVSYTRPIELPVAVEDASNAHR